MVVAGLSRRPERAPSVVMSTAIKPSPTARRPCGAKAASYGIKVRPLPAGYATPRKLKGCAGELGKRADWRAIESAYAARNL